MKIKEIEKGKFAIVTEDGKIFMDFVYDSYEEAETALMLINLSQNLKGGKK